MNPVALAGAAKAAAEELGFEACGISDLSASEAAAALDRWLDLGFNGEMRYMERQAPVRREPARAWPEARSAIVILHNYYQAHAEPAPARGRIARYALGDDYHSVMSDKLENLAARLLAAAGAGRFRAYVDAGPLPERELARRAGLGWIGKNTMLIRPGLGSFTFIGVLLTDLALAPDQPFEADRCGTCRRCLDACPTTAFPEPRVLDATRCISYLTIEARGAMPEPLAPLLGDWLFGCDVCQDVCPWNARFAAETRESRYRSRPASDWPTLVEVAAMTERAFDEAFGESALERAGRAGLARNAAVALENTRARGAAECPAA
ncbi:MAG: tRNA epoxyqueuosine(34) reductase QueG [Gemmatimonadales bacterium]|jgi:epoxyqueuosine reductase